MRMKKNLGIWMDHANAHLMEFSTESVEIETIPSSFNHQQKEESMRKSEKLMHQKEQHQQQKRRCQNGAEQREQQI